jgi:hypothetical protein
VTPCPPVIPGRDEERVCVKERGAFVDTFLLSISCLFKKRNRGLTENDRERETRG